MNNKDTVSGKRVLSSAEELFFHFGYSKTTVDEIAKKACISKRTLYKYYRSKEDILRDYLNKKTDFLTKELNLIANSDDSFPEKMHSALTLTTKTLSTVSRHFIEDIQTNAPNLWQKLSEYRKKMVNTVFVKLLDDGIKTGYVRKNINRSVVVMVMLSVMDNLINATVDKTLPDYMHGNIPKSIDSIFYEIIAIIQNGILNDKNVL